MCVVEAVVAHRAMDETANAGVLAGPDHEEF